MLKNGSKICTCKRKGCERFGKCTECIEYHKANKRYAPYCMRKRKSDKNKTNRS